MNKADKNSLRDAIDCEGFDYALTSYSSWSDIESEEFQKLYKIFVESRIALIKFLKQEIPDLDEI
jgi:hypothetical protein